MEFGLHLPNAGPFANGPDILRVARTAEELGFHSVWLFDHLFTPTNLESKYPYSPDGSYAMLPEFPFYDPVSVMGALAGATERIKFGTRVLIATYGHPRTHGHARPLLRRGRPFHRRPPAREPGVPRHLARGAARPG